MIEGAVVIDRLKDAFKGLPPQWQVWLMGLAGAVLPAVGDALFDAGHALVTGAEPVSKASVWKLVLIGFATGMTAGRAYSAESPMPIPRRVWTFAEREAERKRLAALKAREGR